MFGAQQVIKQPKTKRNKTFNFDKFIWAEKKTQKRDSLLTSILLPVALFSLTICHMSRVKYSDIFV